MKDEFLFGTAGELKLDPSQRKPVIVDVDKDELAHPNVSCYSESSGFERSLIILKPRKTDKLGI